MEISKYVPQGVIKHKDLLYLSDLSPEEIFEFLYEAKSIKQKLAVGEQYKPLKNKSFALLFDTTSIRTHLCFQVAVRQLGGDFYSIPKNQISTTRPNSLIDTARYMPKYGLSGVVMSCYTDAELNTFAKNCPLPVINAKTVTSNPSQVLSDLYTIWEKFGSFKNVRLAYVGKSDEVSNSLIIGAAKTGMEITFACPAKYAPTDVLVRKTMQYGEFKLTEDINEAVKGADIVYTSAYATEDNELTASVLADLKDYRVDRNVMDLAKPNAIFMHSMPAFRGEEVTEQVIDSPKSAVVLQVENRLIMNRAIYSLLTK